MWFLYLDESGDLGFDFVNKKPSRYFVIVVFAIRSLENEKKLRIAVKRTLRKKINHKRKNKLLNELKGNQLNLSHKKYLYKHLNFSYAAYTIILNKRKVFDYLANDKSRVYNYVSRLLVEKLSFEKADKSIHFYIDKCKTKPEIEDFNSYIESQLEGRLSPDVSLDIHHENSTNIAGLQVADLFAYGIFRKYEKSDLNWYDVFKDKIAFEELYLK